MSSRALRYGPLILNWGTNVALVLLVGAVIAVMLAPHVLGWRYGILRSGSMSPAMPAGAAIVVAPASRADLHPGDVITYRASENRHVLITHRVFSVAYNEAGDPSYVVKGDGNKAPDAGLVDESQLLGKVVFSFPQLGLIAQRLHAPTAFFLLVALPAALIISLESRELLESVKDALRRKDKKVTA